MKLYRSLCNVIKFRTHFDFGGREVAHWFPGHMAKGLKQMRASLKNVDCIIEIHDARLPFSGRNHMFQETLDVKPHLLVLNKMDLADLSNKQRILKELNKTGVKNVLFTDCLKQRDDNVKRLVPTVVEIIAKSNRFNREENRNYCLMVIGVPNVGKSSLINSVRRTYLKKGRASRVGGEPGITRAVLTKIQVCERPIMYLLDTPGVLPPKIESVETGMKLALCGTILDHLVGEDIIADYLLYSLNRLEKFSYVEKYNLQEPSDDIQHVLKRIAVKLRKTQRIKALTGATSPSLFQTTLQQRTISSEPSGKESLAKSSWTETAYFTVDKLHQDAPCTFRQCL
ncbi:mitochondrial ribosome-associated GTPase 1 isoform X1 [Dunckerocampus dactyliophorus]|uniref:mitochondrial ribosome-associated GTPase 1 isoform X1 n=1 Tax=Dunckerocampus dactyliophorus TaxID=161453 RepID=UPI00240536AF|nr:mitochondrial ribosome-associated GTPase 1 isoform X1 [Dunckerocampus dactyliophorus]